MVLPFTDVFRIVDGRIAEHRVYYDSASMLGQLGLLPEPASA
jgi:ketosteroid isomerase-like protein